MPTASTLAVFAVAALALLVVPGPSVMYIVTRGISQGRQAALVSVLGIQSGTLVHIAAVALGLSALLVSSATAFNVVKYAGAVYLVGLGVKTMLSREPVHAARTMAPDGLRRIYAQGAVVNILNPKTALFFLALFPQFVHRDQGSVLGQTLTLGGIFLVIALLSDGTYAMLSGTLGGWLRERAGFARAQRHVSGVIYVGLGVTAALVGRSGE